MALTEEEKKELVKNVVNQLKTDSQSVDELETVDTLEGVVSLPAMRGEKVVGAPLKLLSKPAEEAAAVARKLAVVADASAKKADASAAVADASAKKANASAKKADATVAIMSGYEDRVKLAMNGASARFDGFVEGVVVELMSVTSVDGIYYDKTNKRFCAKKGDRYYNNWAIGNDVNAASMYLDDGRKTPRKDKVYVCGTCLYVWNDKEDDLVVVDKTTKELGTWLITHENVTTIDALNQELDAFDAKTAQGLHRVKCWGIPLLVTFANLNVGDNVLMQTIYGSLTMKSDGSGIASINSIGQHAISVRYYNNGKWNSWGRYGAIAQDGVEGTSKHYVYSSASDETRCVLSSKMWTYVHTDGNLFLRFKKWGANNDTVAQDYSQVMLTGRVSNDKWGLMNPYLYARLNNHTLTEGLSTLDEVKVNYTRFDESGNKVLTLTKATTAKAGVMTAGDKKRLDELIGVKNLGWYSVSSGGESAAVKELGNYATCPFMVYDVGTVMSGVVMQVRIGQNSYRQWLRLGTSLQYRDIARKAGTTQFEVGGWNALMDFTPTHAKQIVANREDIASNMQNIHSNTSRLDGIDGTIESFGSSITEQAKRIYDLEQCRPLATNRRNGFMSSEDKTQLQGAFDDLTTRQQAQGVAGYVGKNNVIEVQNSVGNTYVDADIYRNAEERDYTPGANFDVYISAGYDEEQPDKQCIWFGSPIEPTKYVRYRLNYWLHSPTDTLVGKYLYDAINNKYYEVREGAVGEYISETSDDIPCIMTIADKCLLNRIRKMLNL
ncbi:hypothetical protein [uncultured Prevotellamassilia sp.]|uniref:hypothetical protein n=1 Tax=uncultured Prevotellamassilia sp. TaxID=1926676 RepID=UPI00258A7BB4|nr:hypothetical protein [uncultured Prevotellamassilia sp.]